MFLNQALLQKNAGGGWVFHYPNESLNNITKESYLSNLPKWGEVQLSELYLLNKVSYLMNNNLYPILIIPTKNEATFKIFIL